MFDENKLREEIIKVWGEHGAHCEVFDDMLKRLYPPIEFKIGDKVRIPKGNAGFGITGEITNIFDDKNALYFVNNYNEALFDYELEHI